VVQRLRAVFGVRQATLAAFLILAINQTSRAVADLTPCEAFGAADGVFIGEAGPLVDRPVEQANGEQVTVTFAPVLVERPFRGVSTPVVYVTAGNSFLTAGRRYLVYGRTYAGSDMFISDPAYGTKPVTDAGRDLEFLDLVAANADGAAISGVLELDESDHAQIGKDVSPLSNIALRLSTANSVRTITTSADGRFAISGMASGEYQIDVRLPSDLALANNAPTSVRALTRGCASVRIHAVPNGRIRGVVTTLDGRSPVLARIALISAHLVNQGDAYSQEVSPDKYGRVEFTGVRPGRYLLGRLGFNRGGNRIPTVYYPGTLDRAAAFVVAVDRYGFQDVGEFRLPADRN
jgi:hypothetical protein